MTHETATQIIAAAAAVERALAAAVEREVLTQQAIALGFEPGVAPQVAAIAIEQSRQTGLTPAQLLVSLSSVAQLNQPVGASWPLGRTIGPDRTERARHTPWSAWRHAVRFVRRAMLRR